MDDLKYLLADFIDTFNRVDESMKKKIVKSFPFKDIKIKKHKAYIAAMVEELCYTNNIEIPDWVFDREYSLKEPFFVGGFENLKAFLLVESPVSFRRRNIFVSYNVLKRV